MDTLDRPRIEPQERDIIWAHRANAHGPMPTSYFLRYSGASIFGGKHRLKDLVDAGYFYKPIRRYKSFRPSINDQEVYACDEIADDMLLRKELTHKRSQSLNRFNLHHELFLACATASIELTAIDSGAKFLFESHLLGTATREIPCHIEHQGRVWENDAWAPTFDRSDKALIPDAYFAIKRHGNVRYFLEVDCGNEPNYRTDLDEKSWRATLLKYIKVMESGTYKSHFGLESPALVLLLFTRQSKMEAVQKLLLDLTNQKGKNYFRFKTWSDFDKPWFIPKDINTDLIKDPWYAVGHDRSGKPHPPICL